MEAASCTDAGLEDTALTVDEGFVWKVGLLLEIAASQSVGREEMEETVRSAVTYSTAREALEDALAGSGIGAQLNEVRLRMGVVAKQGRTTGAVA